MRLFTPMRSGALRALCLTLLLFAVEATARVIPSAPVTNWPVTPAVQKRAARHSVVLELVSYGASCGYCVPNLARVVVHDSMGIEAPRDVTPGGTPADITTAAAWEGADGTLRLLVSGVVDLPGGPPLTRRILYSPDGGATWTPVALPVGSGLRGSRLRMPEPSGRDFGGPVARGVGSPIRLGTAAVPFVLAVSSSDSGGIWGVRADGSAYSLTPPALAGELLGSDFGGTSFLALLYPAPPENPGLVPWTLSVLDLAGITSKIFDTAHFAWVPWMEGWITPDGSAYINVDWTWGGSSVPPSKPPILPATRSLALWKGGSISEVVSTETGRVLGVPTPDYSGAWIVSRDTGPTVLASHTSVRGLVEAWRDESRPSISGIFAADSGERLLFLRTDLVRSAPGPLGLAVWNVGQAAPAAWDRVVLDALYAPGSAILVHLDVDAAATAGASVFVDPGSPEIDLAGPAGEPPPPTMPSFFQTAPLTRFSLRQQLVIPASARMPGLFGASWRTDLILRNTGAYPLPVTVRFLPNPATPPSAPDASVTVAPRGISVIPDALGSLFRLEQGSGALLLLPGSGGTLEATSRSYTVSSKGSYGMAVDAEDVIAATRPPYSQSFSAGLLGSGFRTNLVSCDLSGAGSRADLFTAPGGGATARTLSIEVPPGGQTQLDDVAGQTGMPAAQTGSFLVTSGSGAALTGFTAIDNATNDPTWSGPDVRPGPLTIPAIVHADGMNGARYRTDLFLYNPDSVARTVHLRVAPWNEPAKGASVTLEPGESRRLPDALSTVFGLNGVAQLSFESGFPSGGVSITSRTYTLLPDGSTYGMLVPPLIASQIAGPGETLEILGPTGGAASRTNLSLVKLDSRPSLVHVEIGDENGTPIDAFDKEVPGRGGVQVNDLFRARGFGDGPRAALIRLSLPPGDPSGVRLAAYATTIDNGTNDPIYFVGHLATEE
jgi:hypothetical protein